MAMAAMVLGGPTWGIIIAALSFTNYREIRAHKPVPMVAFNLGQLVISSGLAGLTYARLGGRFLQGADGAFHGWSVGDFPSMLVPMAAAAILCVTVNMLLTATAMGLIMHRPVRSTVATMLALMPTQLALAFVGYLIGETLAISALALPLFVAPLVVARQLYMRYVDMKGAFVDTSPLACRSSRSEGPVHARPLRARRRIRRCARPGAQPECGRSRGWSTRHCCTTLASSLCRVPFS